MKRIYLRGKYSNLFAIVDDSDFDYLKQFKWYYNDGYARRFTYKNKGKNNYDKSYKMHREILNVPSNLQTDHINRKKLDNRRCNLRICTNSHNQWNRVSYRGKSKYKGISWSKRDKKWIAIIGKNKIQYNLGSFETEREAALTYNRKAKELFGEFARLNQI